MLNKNVRKIEDDVLSACETSHRSRKEVQVIAVTKTVSSEEAKELIDLGVVNLAENRVDKLLEKQQALSDVPQITWHLIGNLQRRKVKTVINRIDYFHALESLSLAEEINKRAEQCIRCFVEVNVSGEVNKHGIPLEEVQTFIQALEYYDKIQVVGLMTMAPYQANETIIQSIFSKLKQKQVEIKQQNWHHAPCTELSMGMSQDYKIAIQEGATFVRIGTAFFSAE
ncbi:YggS family pyridoxal phosphate-dependent enzyme [Vagococcus entomophilus]|uniref:Pyridoxal phosphate homeostasis protein n=1 Tax=Vagococcus entomophilus TaxID=1160095 RepID=A0A430AI87_9ENTE|nr:YggS family pyridoxal phosphate-dependent enzyme [Vagococcus entomophilus]RSU07836.1 YggS family pyridoxal phosphate enzyme [Vagococcus entomophilus]